MNGLLIISTVWPLPLNFWSDISFFSKFLLNFLRFGKKKKKINDQCLHFNASNAFFSSLVNSMLTTTLKCVKYVSTFNSVHFFNHFIVKLFIDELHYNIFMYFNIDLNVDLLMSWISRTKRHWIDIIKRFKQFRVKVLLQWSSRGQRTDRINRQ